MSQSIDDELQEEESDIVSHRYHRKSPSIYQQYLNVVTAASKQVTRKSLESSSEPVQQAFMKFVNKKTLPAGLVRLAKIINNISVRVWLPPYIIKSAIPLLAIDYKNLDESKEKKYNGDIASLTKEYMCSRDSQKINELAAAFRTMQTYIQIAAKVEVFSSSQSIPRKIVGGLRLRQPKKVYPLNLSHFMVKHSSTNLHCSDMRVYYVVALVNANQESDVISTSPPMDDNENITEYGCEKTFELNDYGMKTKKMKQKKEKLPKQRKKSKRKYFRRKSQPPKKFDPNASNNPVCIPYQLRGEKATFADLQSLRIRKLKPENARVRPVNSLTTAFCDTPWFRKQLKTGEYSKPIPFVQSQSRTPGGKRCLFERKLNERAALCVHQPIPMPLCLKLYPVASSWIEQYPDNFNEFYEAYRHYVMTSHNIYRRQEENNWMNYQNELQKQRNNPFTDYAVIRHLNLDKSTMMSMSQELWDQALESDKNLVSLLQNASIQSQ